MHILLFFLCVSMLTSGILFALVYTNKNNKNLLEAKKKKLSLDKLNPCQQRVNQSILFKDNRTRATAEVATIKTAVGHIYVHLCILTKEYLHGGVTL